MRLPCMHTQSARCARAARYTKTSKRRWARKMGEHTTETALTRPDHHEQEEAEHDGPDRQLGLGLLRAGWRA